MEYFTSLVNYNRGEKQHNSKGLKPELITFPTSTNNTPEQVAKTYGPTPCEVILQWYVHHLNMVNISKVLIYFKQRTHT